MTTLNFAQISDIHISSLGDHHDLVSGQAADFLSQVLTHLNTLDDLEFVLLTGDLFDTASQEEFERFQQVIRILTKPYYVIPGNHDRRSTNSTAGLTRRWFAEQFNPQVAARPVAPDAQAGYWSIALGPAVQLIGLDSVRNQDWGGLIGQMQLTWLKSELAAHREKLVILATHHPLHALAPIDQHPDWTNFVCANGSEVLAELDRSPQVGLVLTGHHHLTKADRMGRRLHLACPAIAGYPCAYRTLRLTPTSAHTWQVDWQTHPAAEAMTTAEARRRLVEAWVKHGFEPDFVEAYARLVQGSEQDRNGSLELIGVEA